MKVRKALPKLLGRLEPVFHFAARDGGLAPLRIVSIFANRPASASAIPCLKDSGIQESSFSTTNFVTFARSSAGRALNCSITSAALMRKTYNRPHRGAIPPTEARAMESRAFFHSGEDRQSRRSERFAYGINRGATNRQLVHDTEAR